VKYQLVSEFTELLADVNTEIVSLQADFVEADQSFFEKGNTERPKYVFERSFFM
jgi:glycine cleavage system regulatory protein